MGKIEPMVIEGQNEVMMAILPNCDVNVQKLSTVHRDRDSSTKAEHRVYGGQ